MFFNSKTRELKKIRKLLDTESRLRHAGDYTGALKVLDKILKINPNIYDAVNNKGGILLLMTKYKEALPILERAVALDPDNGQSINNLAYATYATGEVEKSIDLYYQAIRKGYVHEGIYYNLGQALITLGKIEEGLIHWDKALQKNPSYEAPLAELHRMGVAFGVISPSESVDRSVIAKIISSGRIGDIEFFGRSGANALWGISPRRTKK